MKEKLAKIGRRFTAAQAAKARDISNDIAEDIDNGESRELLRMVVAYYHDKYSDTLMRKASTFRNAQLDKAMKMMTQRMAQEKDVEKLQEVLVAKDAEIAKLKSEIALHISNSRPG